MMVNTRFLVVELIAILYLIITMQDQCGGFINSEEEAEALLEFKKGFKDLSNSLSSWTSTKDCCQWKGVKCNTTTGHVISLNLCCSNSNSKLQGDLTSSLLQLPYLASLNLSGNDFMQSRLPAFLGNMKNLKHLDLSNANFKGIIPHNLGNLSLLESLDLSGNNLFVDNLNWLHGLSSLKILDLSDIDLSSCVNDWFHDISTLPSLVTLHLSCCRLQELPTSSPPHLNFDSLVTLDLSNNYFHNSIPDWLFEKCNHLQHLDLSNNFLKGPIPDSIERLTALTTLDLSQNALTGSIPSTLGQGHGKNGEATISCLKELRLSSNQLNGSLERSLPRLSKLVVLDLAHNEFEGNITDAHLANFNSLRVLDLSYYPWARNPWPRDGPFKLVTLNMSKSWVPSFQLESIGLAYCQLGPQFPKWIQTQKNLSHIDISNARIHDAVPSWFWDLSPSIEYMNLSSNGLRGCGQDFSQKIKLKKLDLSGNEFSCPLPRLPPNSRSLDLSGNSFDGTISHVCEMLDVNNSLEILDLSSNGFSGFIPNCWTHGRNLIVLNLANNHFNGSIPDSLGRLINLHSLFVNNNSLSGKIPETLKNCQLLSFLNLGSNRFGGPIPLWIGTGMPILEALMLRRNSFEENIPTTLCLLKSLMILDLAENQLTGTIPRCVFPAMATRESINEKSYMEFQMISESISIYLSSRKKYRFQLQVKGREMTFTDKFVSEFGTMRVIDLSSNFLTQGIPVEIGELVELTGLNLSRNQLVGPIPSAIGKMKNLEWLDLSTNLLSCAIPTSMVNLSFLELLNLSHNSLSGIIPSRNQFATFDESSYEGNPHLCGFPLAETCPTNSSLEDTQCSGNKEEHENDGNDGDGVTTTVLGIIPSFYISMCIGFITAFWGFWGSLILVTSWRYAYFRFLDNMCDWIYVAVAVALAKLRRKLQNQSPLNC